MDSLTQRRIEYIKQKIREYFRLVVSKILPEKTVLFNQRCIYLKRGDTGISVDLFLRGKREDIITDLLLKDQEIVGDTFVDIGANLGYYPLVLADKFEKFILFEPNPFLIPLLHLTVRSLNEKGKEILIFNEAVVKENSPHAILYLAPQSNLSSLFKRTNNKIRVPTHNILEIFSRYRPDFVKMDIEGGEYSLLRDIHTFSYTPHQLFVEIHFNMFDKKESISLLRDLQKAGYFIKYAVEESKTILFKEKRRGLLAQNKSIDWFLKKWSSIVRGETKEGIEFLFAKKDA